MTDHRDEITEFDLVAYADGALDPDRSKAVEAYLAAHPDIAARVNDYARQNAELRERFDPIVSEPIPDRLHAPFGRPAGPGMTAVARAVAIAVIVLATGVAGWMVGRSSDTNRYAVEAFVRSASAAHEDPAIASPAVVSSVPPLHWLSESIGLELRTPDLGELGFQLVEKRLVHLENDRGVQLLYKSGGGESLSIFVKRRWRERKPDYEVQESEGLMVAYWLDGPLAYAITGNLSPERLRSLAQSVNGSMALEPRVKEPRLQPRRKPQAASDERPGEPSVGGSEAGPPAAGSKTTGKM